MLQIENQQLLVNAQGLDDRETAVYRKTMIRKIDLPPNVDTSDTNCDISADGILTVEMPFNMPTEKPRPRADPALVPIITENGRRQIRLQFNIGPDFTLDDVKVPG